MEAFPFTDEDENPIWTALRMLADEDRAHARRMAKLKEMWPEVVAWDFENNKPWEEMDPGILHVLADRFAPFLRD